MQLEVNRISANLVEDFCSILKEAAMWLQSQGHEMWSIDQVSKECVLRNYRLEEMFLGYTDGCPAATMVLQEEDDVFWPSVTKNESLFLHKLSIRRQFAKTGLATYMVSWAIQDAIKRDKKYLRLDCAADRPKLRSFYESQGFRKVTELVMFDKYPTAFYELQVE